MIQRIINKLAKSDQSGLLKIFNREQIKCAWSTYKSHKETGYKPWAKAIVRDIQMRYFHGSIDSEKVWDLVDFLNKYFKVKLRYKFVHSTKIIKLY